MGKLFVLVISLLACVQVVWAGCINDPNGVCTATFAKDTVITLTATPDPESNFIKWTGDFCNGSKAKTCTFTMPNRNVTINAEFRKKPMKPVWRRDG